MPETIIKDAITGEIITISPRLATKNQNYTFILADVDKIFIHSSDSSHTWTIPPQSSIKWPNGIRIHITKNGGTGTLTIARGSGVALYIAGTNSDGNVTLAASARYSTHIFKIADNVWILEEDSSVTLDSELSALAALTSAADKLPYFTGSGTAALADFTAFSRSFLDDADEATFKATVNLEIGVDVQAYDADLTTWAGVTPTSGITTFLATPSSANLLAAITDETGTGSLVFGTSPTIATPSLSAPTISGTIAGAPTASGIWTFSVSPTGPTPTAATELTTKAYVDSVATGLQVKADVACATTANITLSGEQTIDGVVTSASRVLVKNQSTDSQNGIYVSAAGAWSRSTDMNTWAETIGALIPVTGGTVNANITFASTTAAGGTLDTTSIVFATFLITSGLQPLDSDLTALAANAANGLWARTGSGTGSARTITGTANQITVSNGDGAGGDPTLSLPTTIDITTAGVFKTGTIELGHATDTTLDRLSAGQITIEGVQIATASNTLTFTGKTLTSPAVNGTVTTTGLTMPAFTLGGVVTSNGQSFSGTIANLGTVTTVDINGGTIDGVTIGGASAGAITGTTITASTKYLSGAGSATAPAYGFSSNTDMGFFLDTEAALFNSATITPAIEGGGQAELGRWDANDTDIDGLSVGSTSGAVILAPPSVHLSVLLRDNDVEDAFQILSGGGNWGTDTTWDTAVFQGKADGRVIVHSDITIDTGSIISASGAISFGNENLSTTGTFSSGVATLATGSTAGTLTLASGSITDSSGAISFGNENLTTTGVITGLTVEATGDTSAGDDAALGYTATEGLILTGQGSTYDVTVKNDADETVLAIPTGTSNVVGLPENYIDNGDFQIWQRGTTFTDLATHVWTADRWAIHHNASNVGAYTIKRQAFTLGQTSVPDNSEYYLEWDQTVAMTGATFADLSQQIEDVRTLAGEQITISVYLRANANKDFVFVTEQYFGAGGSPSAGVFNTSSVQTATTSWVRYTYTCTLASVSGKTLGTDNDDTLNIIIAPLKTASGIAAAIFRLDVANFQVNRGAFAAPYRRKSFALEWQAAQYYHQRLPIYYSNDYASNYRRMTLPYNAKMRELQKEVTLTIQVYAGGAWANVTTANAYAGTNAVIIEPIHSVNYVSVGHGTSQFESIANVGLVVIDAEGGAG